MMTVSRRDFLKSTIGGFVLLNVPLAVPRLSHAKPAPALREFRFNASPASANLGTGNDFVAWTYNGQIPGPEIRVREGETIRVVLSNNLPEPTTIHWHGVPVKNAMDGVPGVTQTPVMPGETFTYEFAARPAGSFMYHSHVNYQLDQGLYGPLIIEPAHSQNSYDIEFTLMLEDWVMKDGGGTANTVRQPAMGMMRGMGMGRRGTRQGPGPLLEPVYDGFAVNGRVFPSLDPLEVRKGDKVKLRIMNPSSATIYDIALAGHTMTITHADGNAVTPVNTDVLRIGMGERYDVEFIADNPGSWFLAARETGFGEGTLRIPIQYRGIRRTDAILPVFNRRMRFASYGDLRILEPSNTALLGPAERVYSQTLSGGMHSPYWTINGYVYPDAERLLVERGERIRLRYSNRSMMPHPMHLHGHFFSVVNTSLPRELWILKDTIIVNPMESIDIEFLADNPGNWFHHCHNLYHMEAGMANVIVYAS
jgi:FtsP/CotA-like multicopper oxidase with cupredoxin domain